MPHDPSHAPSPLPSRDAGHVHPSPADVLAAFVEPIAIGRRVAVVGSAATIAAKRLAEAGARVVYLYDPRLSAQTPMQRLEGGVVVMPFGVGDLGVREGAFDVVVVPDLPALGDVEFALSQVRRLAGQDGVAFVATRNEASTHPWLVSGAPSTGPAYRALFDLCALQFAEVRMFGVAPFAACAIAEFAPDREATISFDASLVTTPETPEWFLASLSQRGAEPPEAYAIVQVPSISIARGPAPAAPVVDLAQARAHAARVAELEADADRLARELERAQAVARRAVESEQRVVVERATLARDLEGVRRQHEAVAGARDRVAALEIELGRAQRERDAAAQAAQESAALRDRLARTERAHNELVASARSLERALGEARKLVTERDAELQALANRLRATEERAARESVERPKRDGITESALREATAHAQRAMTFVTRLEEELQAVSITHEEDVAALEVALRARGEELRGARSELQRRDRLVRELVARLEHLDRDHAASKPVGVAVPQANSDQVDRARRELAAMTEELRARDQALITAQASLDAMTTALDTERARVDSQARDAARREAALQTAQWRIAELEKLSPSSAPPPPPSQQPQERAALLSELDALRRALAQAHAAPVGADLRDALADARAAIAERDALIAQLSRPS